MHAGGLGCSSSTTVLFRELFVLMKLEGGFVPSIEPWMMEAGVATQGLDVTVHSDADLETVERFLQLVVAALDRNIGSGTGTAATGPVRPRPPRP